MSIPLSSPPRPVSLLLAPISLLLLLLVAATATAPPPFGAAAAAAAQPVPASFYGLNAQALFRRPAGEWDEQLEKLTATGVGVVRFGADWQSAEPLAPVAGSHSFAWGRLDSVVSALARHGLRPLPTLDYSAPWAGPAPSPGHHGAPPDPSAYAEFAAAIAARYGAGGTFWGQHPELPSLPIAQYEIWNEENTTEYFEGADPELYARLYAGARRAVHAVDPAASVMVGGVLATRVINPYGWLRSFLAALPQQGREVDALGWHPYYEELADALASLQGLRQTLASLGLDPPIDLTEANYIDGVGPPTLLADLAASMPASDCRVVGLIAYHWGSPARPGRADSFAIADPNGELTPAGAAFSAAIWRARSGALAPPGPICEPGEAGGEAGGGGTGVAAGAGAAVRRGAGGARERDRKAKAARRAARRARAVRRAARKARAVRRGSRSARAARKARAARRRAKEARASRRGAKRAGAAQRARKGRGPHRQ